MSTAIALNPSEGLSGATNATTTFTAAGGTLSSDGSAVSTLRFNYSATLGSSQSLRIEHSKVKGTPTKPALDRHVVRLESTKPAGEDLLAAGVAVTLTVAVPSVQFSASEVTDLVGMLIDFVNDTGVLARLLGSDPIVEV